MTFFLTFKSKKVTQLRSHNEAKNVEKNIYLLSKKTYAPVLITSGNNTQRYYVNIKSQAAVLCSLGVALRFALKKISVPGAELPKHHLPC